MDYHGTKFEFDLQLFADVSVNMTGASVDGKIYYAKIGEAVANWVKASDISDALSASTTVTIVAKLSEKVLTVAAEDKATVTITTESTALKDLTVATAKSFKTEDDLGDIDYPTGTATTSTVAFVGGDGEALGTVSNVKALTNASTSSQIQFDAETAGKATVSAGCKVGNVTVAENKTAIFTLAESSLVSGSVSVAAGASVKVGANTFTNATKSGDNPADAAITAEDGTITFEKNVAFTAGDATVANTSTDAGVTITVGAKGVVSKPSAKAVFTVKENGEDTNLTTYTVADDSTSIVATGDRVGIYTTTEENLSTVTIAADGTLMIGEAKTAANKITLELEDASADLGTGTTLTTYYTLSKASEVALAKDGEDKPVTAAPALEGTTIGYFKVVADWNGAAPTVAVTFVGGKDAQGNVTVDSYLGKVDVDAAAVASVTSNDIEKNLTSLTVSGISGYTIDEDVEDDYAVKVENLYHNATATGADTTTYLTHYALDDEHNTITLEKNETASAVKYYKVTAGKKDEKTGLVKFKIEAADGQPTGGDAAYFAVTTTATGTESKDRTYTLTYEANSYQVGEGALNLTDACWAGIRIDAKAIPKETATEGVSKIVVTGDSTGTADKYTVMGPIANGVDVSGGDVISRTFDHTYYSFEPTTGITLTKAAGTKYYGVTLVGNDGNPKVTFTEITSEDGKTSCANGTYAGSYFTVVTTLTDDDVLGKVSISYTNNGNISLKGLTSTEGTHAAIYLPITASGLTADKVSNLSFALPMKNTVEVSVAGLASGINLTEGSTAVTVDKDGKVTSTGTGIVKDTSDCAYDTKNNISVDLASVGEGETAYFVVTSTPDEKLRVNTLTATKLASGEPAATASYYKVKNTEGTIEVTYTKAATGGIDLGTTTSTFTAASEDIVSIAFDGTTVADSAKVTVKNANAALESLKIGSATYSDESNNWEAAKTAEAISFAASSVFVTGKNSIDLSDFANASGNTTREYELTAAGVDAKGVTKYTIGEAKNSGTYAVESSNFFTVTYNHGEKTVTVIYTPKTEGGIAPATIGALGAISFNGEDLPKGTVKLTLPADVDSFKGTDIKWAITELPSTVKTVENVDTTKGDSYVYADSYVLGTKNALVLGDTAGTKYYRVTAGEKGALGIHTASIGEAFTPTVPEGSTLNTELTKYNYFQVVTTNNATPPTVVVTYHKATHDSEEVEGEMVAYTPIVLADSTVEVNPTGALKNAQITFGANSDGWKGITYNVTNLVNGQTTQDQGDATVTTDYVTTYAITYLAKDSGVTEDDTVTQGANGSINIQDDANKVRYYAVMKAEKDSGTGVIQYSVQQYASESAAKGATGCVGVITVTNGATGYGVTVSYKGEDLAGMTPSMVEQFTINASGAADTVTTIDLANTAGTIAYAITEKAAGVKVENEGANDTFAADATIALADKLTLAGGETALTSYYIVGEDGTLTSSADEPTKTDNYITVTKNADGTSYEIKYTQASQGTAYTLDTAKSTLTIDASAASETAKITLDDGGIANAITGAKGGVTFTDKATLQNTKISHKTTFAWAAGTYYIPQNEEGGTTLPASGATAYETAAGDDVKYNQVVVTVTEGVYKVAIAANMFEANVTTGVMGAGSTANDVEVITVDGKTVTKFDGAGLGAVEVKGFASGASIVNAQPATTFTGTYTMTIGNGTAAVTYKASAENGTISVKNGAGVNGSFVVGPTDEAFAASDAGSASLATQAKSVWVKGEEGSVVATFENGIITSITGLDETDGEVWVKNGENKTYIYKYEDGVITRRDGSGTEVNKVAAVNDTTTNFINLDYQASLTAVKVDAAFNWSGDGKDYYFTTTNGVKTTTGSGSDPTSGESYIHAKFAADGTLTLEGVTATSAKTMNPAPDFKGTISVTPDMAVKYTKGENDLFTVAFTGVLADSTFTGLADDDVTGDTVTTAALAKNDKITVDSVDYVSAAANTTLKFTDGKLTDGTVTVGTTDLLLADGSKVKINSGSAVLAVATDEETGITEISSLTGLDDGETVTVETYDSDGTTKLTTTTYAGTTDAKKVTKTVTDAATGNTETFNLTLSEDKGNVIGVDPVLAKVPKAFDFNDKTTGYFQVSSDTVEIKKVTGNDTISLANDGTVYIKASVENDAKDSGLKVLTLTPMVFNGTELTTDNVDTSVLKLTVTGDSTSGTKLSYDGSQSDAVVTVTNAAGGSVFTNLTEGSTVETKGLASSGTITVNGKTYKAAAADEFKIYAKNSRNTYIVEGTVTATGTLTSSKADGSEVQTLVYTSTAETPDGVKVVYDQNGVPKNITELDAGETVTVTKGTDVTTYSVVANGMPTVVYRAKPDGSVQYKSVSDENTDAAVDDNYGNVAEASTGKFAWSDAKAATTDPVAAATNATGYFLLNDTTKAASVADQPGTVTINYKNYGEVYIKAVYAGDTDTLTLTKQQVGADGVLADVSGGGLGSSDAVTVTVADGKLIQYTRGSEKSIAFANVGAGSVISGTWTANDSVSTATLEKGEKLTVGTKVYTAAASTKISVAGLEGGVPVITAGEVKLSGAASDATATITAQTTDSDKNVITTVVRYDPNSTTVADADKNVSVLVSGGEVKSITGLEALENGNGEKVTVTTTTIPAVGTATTSTATYTAKYSTEPGQIGQVKVTKEEDGVTSTHIFSTGSMNILDGSVIWTPENQVTTRNFAWTKTGYFIAKAYDAKNPTVYYVDDTNGSESVGKQTSPTPPAIKGGDGNVYLEVTSTMDTAGVATVTKLALKKVNANGTFSDATGTIGKIVISAADAAGGITLPAHDGTTIAIGDAKVGSVFMGLDDEDTVAGTGTVGGTVKVNGTSYKTADTGAFQIEGGGDIVKGTFTITGEAASAAEAKPLTASDGGVINQSIKVESTAAVPDGVKVVFDEDKGITSVADVDAGETVTVTMSDNGTKKFVATTDTADASNTLVTQTIHFAGTTMPADLVLTKSAATTGVGTANVLSMTGYQAANKFDFGATETTGQVGLFKVDTNTTTTTIETQKNLPSAFSNSADETYVLVGATKADSGYTINHLEILQYDYDGTGSTLTRKAADTNLEVTITAPTDGNLTLSGSAVQLYTAYKLSDDEKTYVVDPTNSETERTYAINVKGAKAGMTYTGFNELDTISTSGTLAQGTTLTVGTTTYTTTYTAAEASAVTIRGDGKAVKGVFAIGADGLESAHTDNVTKVTTITKVTGAETAVVKFLNGEVDSIKNVTAGQTVTVAETNDSTKAVTTTTYTAEAVEGSTDLKITKVVTADGVATTYTGTVGTTDSVTAAEWTAGTASVSSKFTWKSENGAGYFLTAVTDTVKDFGTELTVEAQPSEVKAVAGSYYLKVAPEGDGKVGGMTLHKVKEDGSLEADSLSAVTTGTINITAPSTKLTLGNITNLNAGVKLNITDAVAYSNITMRTGDALKTATLAINGTVKVNGEDYTAGAEGFLKFQDAAKLVEGTLKFAATSTNQTVTTSKYTVVVADATTTKDTDILVKVLDGEVTSISGFKADGAAVVTIKNSTNSNVLAAYDKSGVTLTSANIPTGAYTTITLDAGKAVKVDNTATYTTGASGTVKFDKAAGGALTVDSGTLKFTEDSKAADGTPATQITTKTDGVVTFDEAATGIEAGNANVLVTVKDGKVTSITGLKTGDTINIGSGETKTTYKATSATVITKKVGNADEVTAYLTTAGGDVVSAKYVEGGDGTDISKEENALEGQLSWADVSGRSTGYFTVDASNKATVQEQSTKVKVGDKLKSGADPMTYVVANAATDEGTKLQTLTIGALSAENNGTTTTITSTDAETLLAGKTITVTAPTTKVTTANGYEIVPALKYEKKETDKYSIVINKVADGSEITGLEAGDKVTTNTLAAGDSVMMNGTAYQTDVKGTLEFLGEGDDSADTPDNRATLLKGVVRLNASAADYTTAVLSGSKDGTGEDITVVAGGKDANNNDVNNDIVVTVANGVVTSITGLETVGATVTVTQTGFPQVTYKLLSREYASYNKTTDVITYNTIIERTEGTGDSAMKTYASFTNLKNIYGTTSANGTVSNGYKEAATTDTDVLTDKLWSNTEGKAQTVYVATTYDAIDKVAYGTTLTMTTDEVATENKIKASDSTNRGKYYVAATVKTKDDVTTITGLAVAQVNALGVPTVVRGATVTSIDIDGAITGGDTKAKISFAIPKTTTVNITNAALGSTFTAVKANDCIDSAATGEAGYALAKGTTTIYNVNDGVQETTKVTYVPVSRDTTTATIITDNDGKITSITGLDTAKESVTIVKTTAAGEVTTVYAVSSVKVGSGTELIMTKTVTEATGAKTVTTALLSGIESPGTYDWATDPDAVLEEDVDSRTVVSEFDWTTDKRATGYFAVTTKNGATSAEVKASTKATTIAPVTRNVANTTSYLAVTIDDADGVLKEIKQVRFDRSDPDADTYNTLQDYSETKFAGTINVTAPTGVELTFDRSTVDTANTIDDTATVAIKGAIAGSSITNLKLGDTVTTAKLAVANNKTLFQNQFVTVGLAGDANGDGIFTVGAAGALSFLAQTVNGDTKLTVTGGTIALAKTTGNTQGINFAYIGTKLVTATKGDITVNVTKNGASYTIGDLKEGETFTVKDFEAGTTKTYKKSGTTLFCSTESGSGTTTSVYTLGTKTSVTSDVLNKTNGWTTYTDANAAFKETADGLELVSGKAVTVDLKLADSRLTSDEKAEATKGLLGASQYDYVVDKYMAKPQAFAGAASVINDMNVVKDVQEQIGQATIGTYDATTKKYTGSTYTATANIAQTIKATDGWKVTGSDYADNITGAAKGNNTLIGGKGDDMLIGGNAADVFEFDFTGNSGKDTVTKYTTGKDAIQIDGGAEALALKSIALVAGQSGRNTADVLLHDGTYNEATGEATNSVLLAGMGNGKAVTINDATYYFGNAATNKAMTFTYTEGAYYLADASANTAKAGNTINVTTDKTKATAKTLGDTVTVNLADTEHYVGIKAVNAKSSGNRVYLAAGDTGATLTGGTYQSTLAGGAGSDSLVGGSGSDVFWFDTVEGTDTVTSYTSGKDSVYLGDFDSASATASTANGLTIKADGKNVVINNGDTGEVTLANAVSATKAVTVLADKDDKTLLSYYVGSAASKAKNNFTATLGTDAIVDNDKNVGLTSYYLGTETANAVDTLSIKTAKGQKTAVNGKFSLADNAAHLSNIDVLDTSAINIAGSKVTLQGSNSGSFTLKGTNGTRNVTDRFDLSNLVEAAAKQVTLTNLDVGEVIELAGGKKLEGSGTSWSITDDSGAVYGTVTLTGASKNAAFTRGTTTEGNVTYTRSVK